METTLRKYLVSFVVSLMLLALGGCSSIRLEAAVNAAFDVVKSTVNTALGFVLL